MAGINAVDAAAAYGKAMTKSGGPNAVESTGSGFQNALSEIVEQTAGAARGAEEASAGAITGSANVIDVVTAMSNAELAVQTVVAVRDKVITAYNDVIRMPL